jgi:hypothetical protein
MNNREPLINQETGTYQDHDDGNIVVNNPAASEQAAITANEIAHNEADDQTGENTVGTY